MSFYPEEAHAAGPAHVELSVVVPVYGCRESLPELHQRVARTAGALVASWELVLVDDCDGENSWDQVADIALRDPRVRAYRLSRNFGQHAAITAGLAMSTGRWVVVMDCDLQDPPERLADLYAKAQEGFDVVLGRRKSKRHSLFRRAAAKFYFSVINAVTSRRFDGEFGSFSIISRKVVDAFLHFRDRDRHYLFILNWLGFDTGTIDYEHQERHSGRSAYTLRRLIRHAIEGMFFQTTHLLRWIVYSGFWMSFAGFVLALYYLYMYFMYNVAPGFTSVVVLLLLIGGFIIMSTGVTGLYIGKVFEQVKGRPLYVIDKSIVRGEKR
ncbi:MAG TPA: glycosyltransferase family 2 protein [Usitatibacter sp.]|jgi:dolichol-phosphate mannosyltransferase|nr:glycosyltransferase family 2 protein [Usitatibacter sp.]